MGSTIEINDTLQITKRQGFPAELHVSKHLENSYKLKNFKDKIFDFKNKPNIRVYQMPPVRVFLVENVEGKWIYWGLAYILEITHDYLKKTTRGRYKIIYINTPDEMKQAHKLIDQNPETSYFG